LKPIPDKEMGEFGGVAPDGSAAYVAVMRFEPTPTIPLVKRVPNRAIEPATANATLAVRLAYAQAANNRRSGRCPNQQPSAMALPRQTCP
jgi:hypothetical protein